ncbi:hypothetical protein NCCP2222_25470 [Sporosarcina sp. NCCP-2222]|nr:hypothetical protein NCCP2222_25470 [Sporosarcina sp. NCCP-2222]
MEISPRTFTIVFFYTGLYGQDLERCIKYFLLIEAPLIDKNMRQQLTLKIGRQLPNGIQREELGKRMISYFFTVVNLVKWKEVVPEIVNQRVEARN